jgi:hypothetical protein
LSLVAVFSISLSEGTSYTVTIFSTFFGERWLDGLDCAGRH